jgi:hypothetical protein
MLRVRLPPSARDAFRIGVRQSLVRTDCPGRHRGKAPCDRSVSGSAREHAKLAGPVRIRSVTRMPD